MRRGRISTVLSIMLRRRIASFAISLTFRDKMRKAIKKIFRGIMSLKLLLGWKLPSLFCLRRTARRKCTWSQFPKARVLRLLRHLNSNKWSRRMPWRRNLKIYVFLISDTTQPSIPQLRVRKTIKLLKDFNCKIKIWKNAWRICSIFSRKKD